jgi:hypothetical protein
MRITVLAFMIFVTGTSARGQSTAIDLGLTGGLFGGYLIDAQFKGINYASETGESFSQNKFSEDVTESYSRYDAGFVFGIGVEYDRTIGFDAKMQYTFIQTWPYEGQEIREKNMALMFSVTYLIIN